MVRPVSWIRLLAARGSDVQRRRPVLGMHNVHSQPLPGHWTLRGEGVDDGGGSTSVVVGMKNLVRRETDGVCCWGFQTCWSWVVLYSKSVLTTIL